MPRSPGDAVASLGETDSKITGRDRLGWGHVRGCRPPPAARLARALGCFMASRLCMSSRRRKGISCSSGCLGFRLTNAFSFLGDNGNGMGCDGASGSPVQRDPAGPRSLPEPHRTGH